MRTDQSMNGYTLHEHDDSEYMRNVQRTLFNLQNKTHTQLEFDDCNNKNHVFDSEYTSNQALEHYNNFFSLFIC